MTQKKCKGLHCRCMNIGGQCPNMHPSQCVEHCPELVARAHPKSTFIEQAIREAMRGGFDPEVQYPFNDGHLPAKQYLDQIHARNLYFLMPEFWRCLGVARGWVGDYQMEDGLWMITNGSKNEDHHIPVSQAKCQQFIDHLWDKKPAESFFEQLLSNK